MTRVRVSMLAVLLTVTASGCEAMRRVSEGAYRNAVTNGAAQELEARGIELREPPDCHLPETGTDSAVLVTCTARTRTGEPVAVDGIAYHADTGRPYETYVLGVGGREVLHKDCLGAGCRPTATNPHTERKDRPPAAYGHVLSVTTPMWR